jgi:hypothetical protein
MALDADLAGREAGTTGSNRPEKHPALCSPAGKILVSAALLLMALIGGYRVIKRGLPDALKTSPDLRGTFLSDRAWVHGLNPYDDNVQREQWRQVRLPGEGDLDRLYFVQSPSLYPPTTLALTSPLSLAPWKSVRLLWLIQNSALTVLAYLSLCNIMRLPLTQWRAQLFAVLWLSLGPFITCIHLGTLTWPAVMLDVLTIWAVTRRRYVLAGVLLGMAAILKPQLSGALLLFYFLRPARKTAWIAVAVFVAASIVGVGKLWIDEIHWVPGLRASLKGIQGPGGFNDASRMNKFAWQVVNFQYPLFGVFHNRTLINCIAFAVALILSVRFFVVWRRSQAAATRIDARHHAVDPAIFDALAAGIPLLICLLPVYHRYYDCLVLTIVLAWGIAFIGTRLNALAWCAVLSTAPFYVSWPYLLDVLAQSGRVSLQTASSWWWQTLVMPCQVWILMALILVLIAALDRTTIGPARPAAA